LNGHLSEIIAASDRLKSHSESLHREKTMKVPAFRLASIAGLIIIACVATTINGTSGDPELQEIAGYKQWHRLTPQPMFVIDSSLAG
jgi:hypothetical protein